MKWGQSQRIDLVWNVHDHPVIALFVLSHEGAINQFNFVLSPGKVFIAFESSPLKGHVNGDDIKEIKAIP